MTRYGRRPWADLDFGGHPSNAPDQKRGTALAKQSALRTRLLHLDVIHYLQAKRQSPHQGFPQQALAH